MSFQFLFFLIITLIRQVPHLKMELLGDKKRKKYSGGEWSTWLMYILYFFIWIPAGYQVFREPSELYWLLVLSTALLLVGIALRFWSLAVLGKYFSSNIVIREGHKLIKTGPYQIIRHPLYLAMILELAGMIGYSRVAFLSFFWILVIIVFIKQAGKEDKILRQEFGKEAQSYQETVSGFFPLRWLKGVK